MAELMDGAYTGQHEMPYGADMLTPVEVERDIGALACIANLGSGGSDDVNPLDSRSNLRGFGALPGQAVRFGNYNPDAISLN